MLLPFATTAFEPFTDQLDALAKRLDERILSRRWQGRLRRSLEAEAVAASTSMEGVPVTVDDALKILAGESPEAVSAHDQALVRGYREAMTFVQRRADDGALTWNRELLVGVQDRVVAGDLRAGAGRLRSGSAWVTNSASGAVVFEPPASEDVPDLVDQIGATVESSHWHPALAAAWTHVAIAAVHPFIDGNGRTARVMASLAMYRGGFRHPAFTSLEEWWGRNTRQYYEAFACLGPKFDPQVDVTPFVIEHLSGQLTQAVGLDLRQHLEGMLWTTLENVLEDHDLPQRLANGLYDAFFDREITTTYYRALIDSSPATARNDLAAGVAAGLLRGEGRTRGRRYRAGERLYESVANLLDTEPAGQAILNELAGRARQALDVPALDLTPPQDSLPGVH